MYVFQIVKAKFTRRTRDVVGCVLILSCILGTPLIFVLTPQIFINVNKFIFFTPVVLSVTLLFYLLEVVISKTYQVGILGFTHDKFIVRTKKYYKEIYFEDVRIIKLKIGTGLGHWLQTKTTLVSIIHYDKQVITLHVNREWFVGKSKQRKRIWNKNLDLLDLLDKNKFATNIKGKIRENECLSE